MGYLAANWFQQGVPTVSLLPRTTRFSGSWSKPSETPKATTGFSSSRHVASFCSRVSDHIFIPLPLCFQIECQKITSKQRLQDQSSQTLGVGKKVLTTYAIVSFFRSRKKFSTTYAIVSLFLPTFQISQKLSIRFHKILHSLSTPKELLPAQCIKSYDWDVRNEAKIHPKKTKQPF